jgi:hypothetical protein
VFHEAAQSDAASTTSSSETVDLSYPPVTTGPYEAYGLIPPEEEEFVQMSATYQDLLDRTLYFRGVIRKYINVFAEQQKIAKGKDDEITYWQNKYRNLQLEVADRKSEQREKWRTAYAARKARRIAREEEIAQENAAQQAKISLMMQQVSDPEEPVSDGFEGESDGFEGEIFAVNRIVCSSSAAAAADTSLGGGLSSGRKVVDLDGPDDEGGVDLDGPDDEGGVDKSKLAAQTSSVLKTKLASTRDPELQEEAIRAVLVGKPDPDAKI